MVVVRGHEIFILHEAKIMQTVEEIWDFQSGR
jgi:hypothetical protein